MTSRDDEFERFFLANYDAVVRVLTLTTGHREQAVDAAQEAFIKAYAKWNKIRHYDAPAAWVRRIAINSCRDHHRSERRRQRREQFYEPTTSPSPDDGVVGNAYAHTLLAQLSPRQREVAVLFYVDDRSVIEIASILDVNEGTVKSNLSDARDRLRDVLARLDNQAGT